MLTDQYTSSTSILIQGLAICILMILGGFLAGRMYGQELAIVKGNSTTIKTVDFDVPILLKLAWPENVKKNLEDVNLENSNVKVYRLESRRRPSVDLFSNKIVQGGLPRINRDLECYLQYKCIYKWVDITQHTSVRPEPDTLYAVLSRLRPNRYYRFAFIIEHELSSKERDAFKKIAIEELDKLVRKPFENLDCATYGDVAQKMLDIIKSIAGNRIIVWNEDALLKEIEENAIAAEADSTTAAEYGYPFDRCKSNIYTVLTILNEIAGRHKDRREGAEDTRNVKPSNAFARFEAAYNALSPFANNESLIKIYQYLENLKMAERARGQEKNTLYNRLHEEGELVINLALTPYWWLATGRQALQSAGTLTSPLNPISETWRTSQINARKKNREITIEALENAEAILKGIQKLTGDNVISQADYETLFSQLHKAHLQLKRANTDEELVIFANILKDREQQIKKIVDGIDAIIANEKIELLLPTAANFQTRAKQYISADVGVLYAPTLEVASPYFGANFYLFPVNKEAPLRSYGLWSSLRRRLAIMIGVTALSIDSDSREDLLASRSMLLGIGVRITDTVRLSSGTILFKESNPNPLVDNTRLTTSGFVSLSLDWDVKDTVQDVYSKIFN